MNNAYQLTRLSFQSAAEQRAYASTHESLYRHVWLFHESVGNQAAPVKTQGICEICDCQTQFCTTPVKQPAGERFDYRANWWGSNACGCGMVTLERSVLHLLFEMYRPLDRVYHVGHFSSFRRWLSERIPDLVSSQYEEGRAHGEMKDGVRYEDITKLSFGSAQFDFVVCMEILEHVPNYKEALREMARVLKPGGKALLSFPWLGKGIYENVTRAEIGSDGTLTHLLPPQYHGDPAKNEGILSFRDFGWEVLDDARAAGFSSVRAEFMFAPVHGYMMLNNPIIVAMR